MRVKVGTKDLKNRLSEHLRRVRRGAVLHVTDRGTVVAELRPVYGGRSREDEIWKELEAEEIVTRGQGAPKDFKPIRPAKRATVSRWIIEERR